MEPEIGTVCPRCGANCDDLDCECEDDCMIAQWGEEQQTAGSMN